MQRWQFAVQRELPGRSLIEVSYVGNRGTRMVVTRDLNPVPEAYLSKSPVRDNPTNNFLSAQVSNPFYPLLPKTNLASTTVSRAQLLRPYPQYNNVQSGQNVGYSWYHSAQVRVEKRFSAGFTASLSYTFSKLMEAVSFLNGFDLRPEEVISSQDRPHRTTLNWLYELPFGRGKTFAGPGNAFATKLISGWQVQGILTNQSGAPLGFGNAIFVGDIKNVPLPKDQRRPGRWFNTEAGFERNNALQLVSNVRRFSSRFGGIRADGPNNWDLSIIKNTSITERTQLQFRAEAINALNHPQFTSPNTTPTSTAFGTITGEFAWPRVVQFGLKLLF
jgi:hypothetical protein